MSLRTGRAWSWVVGGDLERCVRAGGPGGSASGTSLSLSQVRKQAPKVKCVT